MEITKVLKLSDGTSFGITDKEAKSIYEAKDDMLYIERLDQYINKKYITSIVKHWSADYKKMN